MQSEETPTPARKLQLFSTPEGFEAIIDDANPERRRAYQWHRLDIAPRAADEREAAYKKRAAASLEAYKKNIREESIRLYLAAFDVAAPVLEMESEF